MGHELAYFEQAKARWGFPLSQICYSAAYLGTEPLPLPAFDGALRPLDRTWAPGFSGTTATPLGACPIWREAVRRGVLGAFPTGSNQPAGFVGFHEEGSIGMLEVLPAWRRRGLGRAPPAGGGKPGAGAGRPPLRPGDRGQRSPLWPSSKRPA